MNKAIIDAYRHYWGGFANDSDAEVESRLNTEIRRYAILSDNSVCIFKGQPALYDACVSNNAEQFATLLGVPWPVPERVTVKSLAAEVAALHAKFQAFIGQPIV